MISFAIIVFREILEISLILGILLAATRDLKHRYRWLSYGLSGGLIASMVVAIFTRKISDALEGMGQEVFNATILFLSAVLIAWTVVWMRRHAADLCKELKAVSHSVCTGQKPLYTLAIVMGLTVLRDGSEVVMLTYGSIASGVTLSSIIWGGCLGVITGSAVGVGICLGFIKFATRFLFNATSWMLIILAAGMISQSVGYMTAAGFLPEIMYPLWDTSQLIAEDSLAGKILHTLAGYTARPSALQMLFYAMTIILIGLLLKYYEKNTALVKISSRMVVAIFLVGLGSVYSHDAYATKKVYSPYVEKGELEFEIKGSMDFDDRDDKDGIQKQKYGVGYGLTDRWFTEVYGEIEKEFNDAGEDLDFSLTAIEWENKFQLTEKGKYPLDLGFLVEYSVSTEDKHADKLEWVFLFAKDIGSTEHLANIKMEHTVGGGMVDETEGGASWSSRYRLNEHFEPGFEYHADFGGLNERKSFQEQKHQVGPVFYGKLGKQIKYDVGYLLGASDAAPEREIKWILELEHHF